MGRPDVTDTDDALDADPNADEPLVTAGAPSEATEVAVVERASGTVPHERIVVGGCSQGASLALAFAAHRPRRYGGVFALGSGLLGPSVDPSGYGGSLGGTPVFLGCGDADEHVPVGGSNPPDGYDNPYERPRKRG